MKNERYLATRIFSDGIYIILYIYIYISLQVSLPCSSRCGLNCFRKNQNNPIRSANLTKIAAYAIKSEKAAVSFSKPDILDEEIFRG